MSKTLADKAYGALRQDIIRGDLAPGKPLRMADLARRYDMGFSPLREALNRLQSERLVAVESLRGFRTAPLSLSEMEDAVAQRILIEQQALRLSVQRGGADWADELTRTLGALRQSADQASGHQAGSPPDHRIWDLESHHHAFHRALLSACGSGWLMEFFERLYAATERYRIPVLMARRSGDLGRDIQGEHSAIALAALARDADLAAALLAAHYRRTADSLAGRIAQDGLNAQA